jgi:hypothetical protein
LQKILNNFHPSTIESERNKAQGHSNYYPEVLSFENPNLGIDTRVNMTA